ncbi:MAG: hypothetical protein LBT39_07135 [Treponema sp.]|nr:hypothetical protein [Treponema sp.]
MNPVLRSLVLFFILLIPFSFLYAQELNSVLVMPTEGVDEDLEDDAARLMDVAIAEIEREGLYMVVRSQGMPGGISGAPGVGNLPSQDLSPDVVLVFTTTLIREVTDTVYKATLWRLEDSLMIASEEIIYESVEDAIDLLPVLVWSLFSNIPTEIPPEDDFWKRKWLYLGAKAGISPRFYQSSSSGGPNSQALSFDAGIKAQFQFLVLDLPICVTTFSLQGEALITYDTASYNDKRGERVTAADGTVTEKPGDFEINYNFVSLMFPIIVKVNFKPGQFVISPYGGAFFNAPISPEANYTNTNGDVEESRNFTAGQLGFIGGVEVGRRLGPGVISLDVRFSTDTSPWTIRGDPSVTFQRQMLTLAVGYEFGLIDRSLD